MEVSEANVEVRDGLLSSQTPKSQTSTCMIEENINLSKRVAKKKRMTGERYKGYKKSGLNVERVDMGLPCSSREMGLPCSSKKCLKYKNRHCNEISEDDRKVLFDTFCRETSWDQKKIYISSLVVKKAVKRQRTENSQKKVSYEYFIKVNGTR